MERMTPDTTDFNSLSKKQLVELVIAKYNDCFRLEEENKKLKSDLEQFSEAYKRYRDFEKEELAESCYDLEKENKKLKEELSKLKEKYKRQYEHSM